MDVSKLYTKAEEAIKRKNFDLAIEVLKNQILRVNPNDVKARKLLRGTVIEKHKSKPPSKSDVLSKGMVPRIKMVIGKLLKKWDMVIEEAENYLLYDPKNIGVLYSLGEACCETENMIDTAIAVFETIVMWDKSHADSFKKLGYIYDVHKGELEKAQGFYQRAYKLNPQDPAAEKAAKALAARRTQKQYEKAESSKDLIKDKDRAKELEEDQAILRTDDDIKKAIGRVKKKIADRGETKKDLRRLAELYEKLRKFDEAVTYYQKILSQDATDFGAKCKISDCKISKMEAFVSKLKAQAKQNPKDANLQQKFKQAQQQKITVQIEEYNMQVKEQPTNWELWFNLGKALFIGRQYDEAIGSFQKAIEDPRNKTKSLSFMGQAFLKKQEYALAEEQFKSALKSVSPKDPEYLDLLYHLGITYEAGGKREDAVATYTNIYKVNIGYKDVGDRLKKLKK